MAILGSDERGGSDIDGITGGVPGVAGGAEGVTSGIGAVGTGISTSCGSSGCSECGIFRCSSPVGAPSSAP